MTKTIKIGIVGAGDIALNVHIPLLSCIKNVKVVYVADIKEPTINYPQGLQKIKLNDDPSILPDCDIALITVPVGARKLYINEYAKRKTPIFSEKPFAIDVPTHLRFLDTSKKITCNYMRTTYSSIHQLQEIIQSKLFGELKSIDVSEGGIVGKTQKGKEHYQTKKELSGGGILVESGCHTLSQLTHLLQDHNIRVKDATIKEIEGIDIDTTALLQASKKNKRINITYDISLIRPQKTQSSFTFEDAEITFNHIAPESLLHIKPISKKKSHFTFNQDKHCATTFYQAFYLKWMAFLHAIATNQKVDAKKETSLETTRILTEIYEKGKK
jgi:predicted dehydrogenase